MSHFDRSTQTLEEPTKPKKVGGRLADFSDRLARAFSAVEPPAPYDHEPDEEAFFAPEREQPWERIAARFPVAHEGYDRGTVDQYVSELERELAEARTSVASESAIAAEIDRIGEQTSAILRTAHEQAAEITRRARAEADRCIAEAAQRAMAMTQQSEQRLRDLDGETEAIWSERSQLIDDVRSVAGSLMTLADESAKRFPADPVRSQPPGRPAAPSAIPAADPARSQPPPVPASTPAPTPSFAAAQAPTVATQAPMTAAGKIQPDDEPELEDS